MYCPTTQDLKVFKVQRARFCNLFDLPHDTTFTKEWLMSIVNAEPASSIEYNNKSFQTTFTMKYLAKQMLLMEHHVYT